jgi:hypothetical protein
VRIGLERGSRGEPAGHRARLLGDVGQLVRDHVLAVRAVRRECAAAEVDMAAADERLDAGGHLGAVGVELDVVEALAKCARHAIERGHGKSLFAGACAIGGL